MSLQAALEAFLGEPVGAFRSISPGWETEVYAYDQQDGTPMVLRLYQGQHVEARAETEYRMMRYLGQAGYPVPRVDRYHAGPEPLGGPFILMERIEGTTLAYRFRTQPMEQVVAQLCELQVRLHAMDWKPFVGPDRVWPDRASATAFYDNTLFNRLLRDLDLLHAFQPLLDWQESHGRSVTFRLAPLHGDLHVENVLVRPDGSPAVIDWGITGVGDPRCDVAYVYILMMTEGNGKLAELYRQTYEEMAGPIVDFDYFEVWALIRRLMVTVIVLARGSAAMGLRPGLEALMRQHVDYVRHVAALTAERTGLRLPEVEALLAE